MTITVSSPPSDRKICRVNRQKPANSDNTTTDTPTESFWKGDSNGIEQQRDGSKWTEKNPGQSRGDSGRSCAVAYSARCAVKLTSTYPVPRIGKTLEQNTSKGWGSNIKWQFRSRAASKEGRNRCSDVKNGGFSPFLSLLFFFFFPFFFFSFSLFKLAPANTKILPITASTRCLRVFLLMGATFLT